MTNVTITGIICPKASHYSADDVAEKISENGVMLYMSLEDTCGYRFTLDKYQECRETGIDGEILEDVLPREVNGETEYISRLYAYYYHDRLVVHEAEYENGCEYKFDECENTICTGYVDRDTYSTDIVRITRREKDSEFLKFKEKDSRSIVEFETVKDAELFMLKTFRGRGVNRKQILFKILCERWFNLGLSEVEFLWNENGGLSCKYPEDNGLFERSDKEALDMYNSELYMKNLSETTCGAAFGAENGLWNKFPQNIKDDYLDAIIFLYNQIVKQRSYCSISERFVNKLTKIRKERGKKEVYDNTQELALMGTIQVEDRIFVSDPCYWMKRSSDDEEYTPEEVERLGVVLNNPVKGEWNIEIMNHISDRYSYPTGTILAYPKNMKRSELLFDKLFEEEEVGLAVDAGLLSISGIEEQRKHMEYYAAIENDENCYIDNGFSMFSYFGGDGCYPAYISEKNGEQNGILITLHPNGIHKVLEEIGTTRECKESIMSYFWEDELEDEHVIVYAKEEGENIDLYFCDTWLMDSNYKWYEKEISDDWDNTHNYPQCRKGSHGLLRFTIDNKDGKYQVNDKYPNEINKNNLFWIKSEDCDILYKTDIPTGMKELQNRLLDINFYNYREFTDSFRAIELRKKYLT